MTEIKRDLSLNGLNFDGSKHTKKLEAEKESSCVAEGVQNTNLNEAPGNIYGRTLVNNTAGATRKCVEGTTECFMEHPDAFMLSEMVFKNAYDEAIESGKTEKEAYEIATEKAHEYLSGIGETEES